jgi:acyl-CoA thioester hydrolase
MKIRVYYKDTDAGGIVYHSRYLDMCEMTRSELFFKAGMKPYVDDCHFALKNISCDFINYSKLGDLLEVSSKIVELKNASFVIEHEIKRDDELIFSMRATLVFLCKSGKIGKIPQNYINFFKEFLID